MILTDFFSIIIKTTVKIRCTGIIKGGVTFVQHKISTALIFMEVASLSLEFC